VCGSEYYNLIYYRWTDELTKATRGDASCGKSVIKLLCLNYCCRDVTWTQPNSS